MFRDNSRNCVFTNRECTLTSIDDLIKMKHCAGRPRDIEDMNHLERIKILRRRDK